MAKRNSSKWWEQKIANTNWNTYNTIEEKNKDLVTFYAEASESIKDELYELAEKESRDGVLGLSDMYKQNHLTKLNKKIEDHIEELGKKVEETTTKNMQDGFETVYKNVGVQIGDVDFSMLDKTLMDELLQRPWLGSNYSKRLWKNTAKLAAALNNKLLVGLQQGNTVTEIAIGINKVMGQGLYAAHRLVRTETMHYLNDATLQRYKDCGIKWVQVWTAEDERVCEECGPLHGKYYRIDRVPVLPLHPNCRCTIIPVTDEKKIAELESAQIHNVESLMNQKHC